MSILEGKIKSTIYYNETNSYLVALFRISKVSNEEESNYLKKTITITGNVLDLKLETPIQIEGEFIYHEKFGNQFKFNNYEYITPKENDDIIEFLSSSFVKGCGKKTAEKIVAVFGSNTLEVIRKNKFALDKVEGVTEKTRDKIYDSLINYTKSSDVILKIKNLGFSIEEAGKIYIKYKDRIEDILENNLYLLNEVIEFKRLDSIFLNNYHDAYDKRRVKACIIEVMKAISMNLGDIYYHSSDVFSYLDKLFKIQIDYEIFQEYLQELETELFIVRDEERIYLQEYYESEIVIAESLQKIEEKRVNPDDYTEKIKQMEETLHITYNDDQIKAIATSLNNNVSIISGGPGTGKTTIIKAIIKLYIDKYKLNNYNIIENIALLAPTGRAAKK